MDFLIWRSVKAQEYYKDKEQEDHKLFYIRCANDKNALKLFAETAMVELFKREYEGYFKHDLCTSEQYEDRHANDFPENSPPGYYMRRHEWLESYREYTELHFEFIKSNEKTWSVAQGSTADCVLISFPSKLVFKKFMQSLYEASQSSKPTMLGRHLQFCPPSLMF